VPSKRDFESSPSELVVPEISTFGSLKVLFLSPFPPFSPFVFDGFLHQDVVSAKFSIKREDAAVARPFAYQLKNKETLSAFLHWNLDDKTPIKDGDLILVKVHCCSHPVVWFYDSLSNVDFRASWRWSCQ